MIPLCQKRLVKAYEVVIASRFHLRNIAVRKDRPLLRKLLPALLIFVLLHVPTVIPERGWSLQLERTTRVGRRVLAPGEYHVRVTKNGHCASVWFLSSGRVVAKVNGRLEKWVSSFKETGLYYRGRRAEGIFFEGEKDAVSFIGPTRGLAAGKNNLPTLAACTG